MPLEKSVFSTHDIAKICHVAPNTVWRWIKGGKLPFFNTGGGQSRVWRKDLITFLVRLKMPVPAELEAAEAFRVLIVDDDKVVRKMVNKVISLMCPEAEVHEAGDGFDAGRKVSNLLPYLIVLDLRLPGVDGFEVCKAIRSDLKLKKSKILAISGHNVKESKRKVLAAGADSFMAKPLEVEPLREELKSWLPHSTASVLR